MESGRDDEGADEDSGEPTARDWDERRHRDPLSLSRRLDTRTLVWLDDPGARVHILLVGAGLGADEAPSCAPATSLRAPVWPLVARRFAETSVRAELQVSGAAVGASIDDWEEGTPEAVVARIAEQDQPPQFVLWNVAGPQAGEENAQARYEAVFDAVHGAFAERLPGVTWLICRSAESAAARAAAEAIIERYGNTLAGPDMAVGRRLAADGAGGSAEEELAGLLFEALREPLRAWQRAQSALTVPVRARSARRHRQRGGRGRRGARQRLQMSGAPSD